MNKILADKYTEMFRQSFGNVIHEENIIINGKNCVIYRFSPVTPEFNMIGGFSHFIEVQGDTARYFASERSFNNTFVLCEWVFDGEKKTKHINYGTVVSSVADTLNITSNTLKKLKEILG